MNWLDKYTANNISDAVLPVNQILRNSLYYPSCGLDGGLIKDCNTLGSSYGITSFIYCDYAVGEEALLDDLNTFIGYHVVGSRQVKHIELIPNGWKMVFPPGFDSGRYQQYRNCWKPFMRWVIYERDLDHPETHGPPRFSLLYLGGEGVASYQALYWSNRQVPKAVGIVQPGTGFGLNWTDFQAKNGYLAWVINNNPEGTPDLIYFGGYGGPYQDFDWPGFRLIRTIRPYYPEFRGEVCVFQKE